MTYFCNDDEASKPIIEAGLADGTIEKWNRDAQGRQWYRQRPPIHGIPKPVVPDDLVAELADDDDTECELFCDGELLGAGEAPPVRGVDPAAGIVEFEQ